MQPTMFVVAGPPGSGKSTVFPVSGFGVAHFNADDRAAELNGGRYQGIPASIRAVVAPEFEAFVHASIASQESFAIETTLRSETTFRQARLAKAAAFRTEMRFLALEDFSLHVERVKIRADAGGHSASEGTLRQIYLASLGNFRTAVSEMDALWAYDNSVFAGPPRLVLHSECGDVRFLDSNPPRWVIDSIETL